MTKMRNSSNMVLLTFFGSTLPDRVHIGPINFRVRRFVSRSLQCFSCYGYGHGKSSCKEASRCRNCSALDSHSEEHCNGAAYCFHSRDAHQSLVEASARSRASVPVLRSAPGALASIIPSPALTGPSRLLLARHQSPRTPGQGTGLRHTYSRYLKWKCPHCRQPGVNAWHGCLRRPATSAAPPTSAPLSTHSLISVRSLLPRPPPRWC
ncbi:hypothetical protein E2C01_032500 [Portunus trituberculatus]|uniref:CCHC-type domain-containing protein n=1 Tax=Portunus trituberculatus TaxID=210409 RepID=A0A5B7EW57_PORTR|nr:hypothetical protein [Portunus trituberculatus]